MCFRVKCLLVDVFLYLMPSFFLYMVSSSFELWR